MAGKNEIINHYLKLGFDLLGTSQNTLRKVIVDGKNICTSFIKLHKDGSLQGIWNRTASINGKNSSITHVCPDGSQISTDVIKSRFITRDICYNNPYSHYRNEIDLSSDGSKILRKTLLNGFTTTTRNYANKTFYEYGPGIGRCRDLCERMPIWRGLGL